jgi:integrase
VLRGEPAPTPELTLNDLVALYLERHAPSVRPRTISDLRKRLAYATRPFGTVPLRDLERMSGEIASWQARLPERSRYGIVGALRQTLAGGVRWGYMTRNPATLAGRNRQPAPRTVRAYTRAEIDATAAELSPIYQPLPVFAAATGLRPEEWRQLERRDVDRRNGIVTVRATSPAARSSSWRRPSAGLRCRSQGARSSATRPAPAAARDTPLLFPPVAALLGLDNFRRASGRPRSKRPESRRPPGSRPRARSRATRSPLRDGLRAGAMHGTSVQMNERIRTCSTARRRHRRSPRVRASTRADNKRDDGREVKCST